MKIRIVDYLRGLLNRRTVAIFNIFAFFFYFSFLQYFIVWRGMKNVADALIPALDIPNSVESPLIRSCVELTGLNFFTNSAAFNIHLGSTKIVVFFLLLFISAAISASIFYRNKVYLLLFFISFFGLAISSEKYFYLVTTEYSDLHSELTLSEIDFCLMITKNRQ